MSKHTPGPWYLKHSGTVASRESGDVIATTGYNVVVGSTEDEDNAVRIVACVNACAGIENDALAEFPGGTVAGLLELSSRAIGAHKAMREQRDELLEALRCICDSGIPLDESIERQMLEAIAKAEGRA